MDAFIKHLESASSVVRTWPKWKQEVLGGTATMNKNMSLDDIFDILDDLLCSGSFKACSVILRNVSIDEISTTQLVTMLTATVAATSEELPDRQNFFERVKEVLVSRGEPADKILEGLDGKT